MIPYSKQEDFTIEKIEEIQLYSGFPKVKEQINWKQLLVLFERE